jgi:L-rhamnose mutarotase
MTDLAASNPTKRPPQRIAWVTGLKPEKAAYYEQLHANPMPGVNEMMTACNLQNVSVHKAEIDGKQYLFFYCEYTGDDFDADMAKMAADPATQRWWKETDPCQEPLPDAAAQGKIWSDTKEVYYLP